MNFKLRRIFAILLSITLLIVNLFPVSDGEGDVIITPMVESAAAATTTPTPTPTTTVDQYFMVVDSNRYPSGSQIQMKNNSMSLSFTSGNNTVPEMADIQWLDYDKNIINVEKKGKYEATVTAVGPGYAQLGAIINYNGIEYQVFCQIYVPLELDDTANIAKDEYGMQTQIQVTDQEKKTLQLKGPEATDLNHYLVKLKYVKYKDNVTNDTIDTTDPTDTTAESNIFSQPPALRWESSNTTVAAVDKNGVVSAVGAGYAEITVTTTTLSEAGKPATLTFSVLVSATGYIGENQNFQNRFTYDKGGSIIHIQTNAERADNLVWTIHKNSITGEKLNIKDNKFMDVDISNVNGRVTLKNVKAGIYYITARQSDKYEENNTKTQTLHITLIVPVSLPKDPIYMNVGDIYNILEIGNLPSQDYYSFTSGDNNIASVTSSSGVITGKSKGNTKIFMHYKGSLFGSLNSNESNYAKDETLEVYVIDGISLNTSNASIYTGSTLQLVLNTSNNYEPVTWKSTNPSVATVDKEGLVTGVAVGETEIIVSQTINGVTKTATCKILVKQSVTSIKLNPSNTSIAVGDFLTINAEVTPKLNNVSLKWVTSDANIVKITQTGNLSATVSGVKGGTAVITAINQDNVVVGSCLINVYQAIQKITLSDTLVTAPLSAGSFQLYATITPDTAKDQDVIWSSTDTSVITVDQNGKVTLKKAGKAAIVVTSKVNSTIMAICNVIVTKSISGITLDQSIKNMFVGETFRLTYSVKPTDANNVAVTWTSTNSSVASVNAEGVVSAKAVGQATIIVRTIDGGYLATCNITVGRTATAVKLDVTKLTLNVGDYYDFKVTLTPADSTNAALTWESSDKSIAVVSKTGRVTAKKSGTCIIMVKTSSGSSAYCNLTVLQGSSGITISQTTATIYVGGKLELTAKITPEGATDKGVTWKSSNPKVATVDKSGLVKGVAGGVSIITVTSNDGGYVAHCVVTVKEFITTITLNKSYYKLGLNKTYQLVAKINSPNASNQKLKWTSSNKKIVTVDSKGRIKGIALGTAKITVRALDGSGAFATCTVRVTRLVTSISLDVNYLTIVQGKSKKITAKVRPTNATYKVPLWSSNQKDIAIVNKNGVVTALSPGNAIITAKANDSSGVSSICYVKVIAPVASTGITVSESEVVMSPGEAKTVAISIVPNNSTDSYSWSSDNELVAKVDKKTGKITAKAIGTANITVMTESGRRATITVYVVGLSRSEVSLQQYTSLLLNLEVDGAGKNDVKVRWDVDNQEIATVVNGRVTGKAIGTTYVYAVVNGRRLACKVTVTKIK